MPQRRAFLAALLLVPALAVGQEPEPDQSFSDSVDVRLAEVEVLVTDRDGKPVPGLAREDFRVLEDGQPVEVTHLSSTDLQPLVVAVFIDDASLSGSSRGIAYSGLRRFLAGVLKPGDRALLVRFDGSLELQGEPSGDAAVLNATLDRLSRLAGPGFARIQERIAIREQLLYSTPATDAAADEGLALANAEAVFGRLRTYGRARADATRATLQALQQTLALLSTLPERKALVYVGGGLPSSPAADLFELWMEKYGVFAHRVGASPLETTEWDTSRLVQQTAERANAAGITLHALALPASAAASISSGATGGSRGFDPEDSDRAMRTLAGATGGRVMTEAQNPAPFLEATARDLASTYVLGYAPLAGSGKKGRHKLEVSVRNGELRARFREERFDDQHLDSLLRRALAALWSSAGSNPLRAELTIEEQTREEDGRYRVTAVLTFPLSTVFFQPQEHFHIGHLTLAIAVRDGKGRMTGTPRAEVPVEIPNQRLLAAPGQSAGYRFTVQLSPGESLLAIAMRDDLSGTEGVIRTSLNPATAKGK